MMSFEYRRGNRRVSEKHFWDGVKKDALSGAQKEIEKRLSEIRDPETGERLKIRRVHDGSELRWSIEGSPEAIQLAKVVLGGQK